MDPLRGAGAVKTTLKRIVQGTFEGLWSAGFRALGALLRPRPETWSSPGGRRVLVVAPHPDDETAGCGGAILQHRERGDRVLVACATDGRRSRALGLPPGETAAHRRAEMEAAARILDAELDWIGLPEGEWPVEVLAGRLRQTLDGFAPQVVYAPSRVDFHPEHERVARALALALEDRQDPEGPDLGIYPVQVPLTPMLANLVVPVDPASPRLRAAIEAHRSQVGSVERCLRARRYAGKLYGLAGAEELWRLTAVDYARLHRAAPERPPGRDFRGLRYYAWSDPAAYLAGLGARRRLARAAAGDPRSPT